MNALNCDVLVVGGGAAGVAAAAAAGRAGAQVVLLERYGFLGGLATAGAVSTVCGLYLRDTNDARPTPVARGFVQEFAERLARASSAAPQRLEHGLWVLPFQPWAFERVTDTMLAESRDITLALHATAADVSVEARQVLRVRALVWNEPVMILPRSVVDCTGEATIVHLGEDETMDGLAEQTPGLVFFMENVAAGFENRGMLDVLRVLRRAVDAGELETGCERVSLVPADGPGGRVTFKLSLSPAGSGDSHWKHVTAWEREGRARADAIQRFLIANVPAFREARFGGAAPQVGVRAGRRLQGRATLLDDDVLHCRTFADGIARGGWPVEQWGELSRPALAFLSERGCYEIPLDCLRPRGLDNVLAAGRCLSAAPGALASARVIGTALATGWAAGSAAACVAGGKAMEDAVERIRRQLIG